MKTLIAAVGALALVASAASAEPVDKYTITGYAASAAVAQGVPLEQRPGAGSKPGYAAAVAGGGSYRNGREAGVARTSLVRERRIRQN